MAVIYTSSQCHYCEELKTMLRDNGIPFSETTDPGACNFTQTPSTRLANGACLPFSSCGVSCQYTAIANEYSATTTEEPAKVWEQPTEGLPDVWSEQELTVKWGAITSEEAKTYEELDVSSVEPIPPDMPVGLTIALRDHKKVPTGRNIW